MPLVQTGSQETDSRGAARIEGVVNIFLAQILEQATTMHTLVYLTLVDFILQVSTSSSKTDAGL